MKISSILVGLILLRQNDLEMKMKKRVAAIIICITLVASLAACTVVQIQPSLPVATEAPVVNMPNPASVFCEQNGNTLEIQTSADGSQSGICIFPDGSTCDEWAYYKGECGPALKPTSEPAATVDPTQANANGGYMQPGVSEPFTDWWGVIKSTEPGSQYDDYFERQDLGGAILFGIDSLDPAIRSQIEELRDSGKIVHISGTLFSNVPDTNGSQVQVDEIRVEE
jgi:putative hemolysin